MTAEFDNQTGAHKIDKAVEIITDGSFNFGHSELTLDATYSAGFDLVEFDLFL